MKNQYAIAKYPARVLAHKAEDVHFSAAYFEKAMTRFRRANQIAKGVAVAAPQLGISQRFFYFCYDGEEFMAINPELIGHVTLDKVTATEGCLSCPGKDYLAERANHLLWKYTNEAGETVMEDVTGWKARIVTHELDHLDGICLPDKFPEA